MHVIFVSCLFDSKIVLSKALIPLDIKDFWRGYETRASIARKLKFQYVEQNLCIDVCLKLRHIKSICVATIWNRGLRFGSFISYLVVIFELKFYLNFRWMFCKNMLLIDPSHTTVSCCLVFVRTVVNTVKISPRCGSHKLLEEIMRVVVEKWDVFEGELIKITVLHRIC